jgi:RND family efflux transporter MFP subunit
MSLLNQNTKRVFIIALILVLLAALIWHFKGKTKATAAASTNTSKVVLSVSTVQPSLQNWTLNVRVNGAIAAWQEALISAEISGLRIAQVLVDVGAEVKRGQTLVTLNDETIVAAVHKQQATVARDRASLAEAKSNADRARGIKDSGALSTQQINQYLIAEDTAKATLAASEAELENQQIQLKHTRILAADDGVITSRSANLGNVVSIGSELFRLIRQGRIEWRAEVNAQQLSKITKGLKVHLTLPDGKTVEGKVRMTAPTLDANTRNALIYVDLPKGSAHPGMYAQGEIETGAQAALTVPQSAIVLRDGRSYVFEVSANQHVIQHAVTTDRRVGDLVEISTNHTGNDAQGSDITTNTVLVATGGAFLNDGDVVSISKQ